MGISASVLSEDLIGFGKIAEALEHGTREVRELIKTYLEPIVKEKGLLRADGIREERMRKALRIAQDASILIEDASIADRRMPPRLAIPILEIASLEIKEELVEKWVGLLASTATEEGIHTSFYTILSQLISSEAKILDQLYVWHLSCPIRSQTDIQTRAKENWTAEMLRSQLNLPERGSTPHLRNLERLG